MRLYAQTPARRTVQVLVDLVALTLIAVAVWAAFAVRDTILLLAEPGRRIESSGDGLAEELGNAGDAASDVPFVGGVLEKPLRSAADAGAGFADAGASFQETVTQVADVTCAALVVVPVLLVLVLWIPPRLLWIRRSAIVRRLADAPGGTDLLALRALTGPPSVLTRLPTPPGGFADAWRRGDPQVVADLGAAALARTGLRP
ncbi:hypothetical protein [Streptomyces genisteinicus]|uniref:Uncharacterized protein n=1 Tax=Streptomyces genisteinicus TaxID=2768068 RepID=A0A7H0I268_9ACTN|nr:hypothetical protein [Streptomyces genisteinicus]QNP66884.1 hypothetical protein IAG43_30815 [Streptomyces genisteinicus]